MKSIIPNTVVAVFLILSSGLPGIYSLIAGGEVDQQFVEANQDFEAGKLGDAAAKYEKLVADGHVSAELFFNLGTAKYRLDEIGEAVLWMKRALVIEPGMPEVHQSLTFLRSRIAFFEFTETGLDRFIRNLPNSFAKWGMTLSMWTSLILCSALICLPRIRTNFALLITLVVVSAAISVGFARMELYRSHHLAIENFATVVKQGASALTAPVPDAKPLIDLPPGSEVRILQPAGAWTYVEVPGDLHGWVRSDTIEPNWPLPTPTTNESSDVVKEYFRNGNSNEPLLLAPGDSGSGR